MRAGGKGSETTNHALGHVKLEIDDAQPRDSLGRAIIDIRASVIRRTRVLLLGLEDHLVADGDRPIVAIPLSVSLRALCITVVHRFVNYASLYEVRVITKTLTSTPFVGSLPNGYGLVSIS